MWESRKAIDAAYKIADEKRLNWVIKKISSNKHEFDGLIFSNHFLAGGLEVLSPEFGILYKTKEKDGHHTILIFHPGPWVDRALAEAQRIQNEEEKDIVVNFTPINY